MKCKDGKERQALYDAIKRIRDEGESWLTIDGQRVRAIDPRLIETARAGRRYDGGGDCLVRSRRARFGVALASFVTKDAWPRVRISEGRTHRHTSFADLLGVVVERHPRSCARRTA